MTPRIGLNIRSGTRQINRGEESSGVDCGEEYSVDGVESRGVPSHEFSTSECIGKRRTPILYLQSTRQLRFIRRTGDIELSDNWNFCVH
jgi:hypothetical protein